jgi:hypothetical protein
LLLFGVVVVVVADGRMVGSLGIEVPLYIVVDGNEMEGNKGVADSMVLVALAHNHIVEVVHVEDIQAAGERLSSSALS